MNSGAFEHIRGFGFNRFGYPGGWRGGWGGGGFGRGGFGGFGRGCWNCGFGFGNRFGWGLGWGGWGWGGWGWGSPWLGFGWGWGWGWDPFWYDPWWNWGAGYYGYPTNNYYIYNDGGSDNYAPPDNSAPPDQEDQNQNEYQNDQNYQSEPNGDLVTPNEAQPSTSPGAPNLAVPVLIYMKNGSVVAVRDYWMIDNELHYILMNGVQRQADLDQVDLARSNAENAKSGVRFIFKSEPSAPPATETPAPPAAQPDSSTPAPGVQPEGRT